MKINKLSEMKGGWFVGNFEPSVFRTENAEVAVKHYKKGDNEKWHYHKIASEITVIVNGKVKMNDLVLEAGDVIVLKPSEGTDFFALEDSITTVVKIPAALNDKYFDRE